MVVRRGILPLLLLLPLVLLVLVLVLQGEAFVVGCFVADIIQDSWGGGAYFARIA